LATAYCLFTLATRWGKKIEVGFYHSGMNETVPLDPHETKTLVNL